MRSATMKNVAVRPRASRAGSAYVKSDALPSSIVMLMNG